MENTLVGVCIVLCTVCSCSAASHPCRQCTRTSRKPQKPCSCWGRAERLRGVHVCLAGTHTHTNVCFGVLCAQSGLMCRPLRLPFATRNGIKLGARSIIAERG